MVESIDKIRSVINNEGKTSEVSPWNKPFAVVSVVKVTEPRSTWEVGPAHAMGMITVTLVEVTTPWPGSVTEPV